MPVDPVLGAILLAVVGFFFFIYLMLRRTVLGFQEGVESGYDRKR